MKVPICISDIGFQFSVFSFRLCRRFSFFGVQFASTHFFTAGFFHGLQDATTARTGLLPFRQKQP
jgi:hypothetical protein